MILTGLLWHFTSEFGNKSSPYFSNSSLGSLLYTCSEPSFMGVPSKVNLASLWPTPKCTVTSLPRIFDREQRTKKKVEWLSCIWTAFLYPRARDHPLHKESIQQLTDKQRKWKTDAVLSHFGVGYCYFNYFVLL